jgi:hypothetical protein
MDIDSTIEEIGRDATDEASNIAADEAVGRTDEEAAHEEAATETAEEGGIKSAEATKDIPVSGAPSADSAMRAFLTGKAAVIDHPSPNPNLRRRHSQNSFQDELWFL